MSQSIPYEWRYQGCLRHECHKRVDLLCFCCQHLKLHGRHGLSCGVNAIKFFNVNDNKCGYFKKVPLEEFVKERIEKQKVC